MFAVFYLIVSLIVGDLLVRRFYTFVSVPHRLASAFLTGTIVSAWFTYLSALALSQTSRPMLWANVLFFVAALGFIFYSKQLLPSLEDLREAIGSLSEEKWDLAIIGIFAVLVMWMMFGTFSYVDGAVRIANHQWSDFGSTVSIMQSFAVGHNFPTEYPHFTGDRIRYHFLFFFQAGNLEYLGFNPALASNSLSILSLVSMLILVMTLGRVIFNSRVAGRIGAALFFFHGSLAFIPFLYKLGSLDAIFGRLKKTQDFLPSGFPYRGEDWGVWSQVVYLNQRHLASSIGIFLVVLVFLALKYRDRADVDTEVRDAVPDWDNGSQTADWKTWLERATPFIFSGALLGLLPMWNGAVFAAAGAVLAVLFILFPFRKEMIALGVSAIITALPQVYYLKADTPRPAGFSLFHWGYTVDQPGILNVAYYLLFTFGFKWLLIGVAIYFAGSLQRRFFAAISALIALAFCFQFSDEVLANHKFLNLWLVAANVFAGYGLMKVWNMKLGSTVLAGRIAAAILVVLVTLGGIIDFFPVKNGYYVEMKFEGDRLVDWVRQNTDPKAIFLSHRFVNHRILLAGRRLFYGHPYYSWSAGYDTGKRDADYKKMFESKDAAEVHRLLKENRISYVAIDEAVRSSGFVKGHNEVIYEAYFARVFADTENRYDKMNIYAVPDALGAPNPNVPLSAASAVNDKKSSVSAFEGGEGNAPGQLSKPRGIISDGKGNFLIADTGNARVQKFDADGKFVVAFGKPGAEPGEFREPNGVAVDADGDIYVTDSLANKLLRFKSDGKFVKEWGGPDPGFYGPRDLVIGPNKLIYIIDQGRTRVVRFDPATEAFTEWGSGGSGEGQFNEATGITIGQNEVYVMDAGNNRIQVFDLEGKFLRMWEVPVWEKYLWHYPDAVFDEQTKRLYVTNGWKKEVLTFDANGNAGDKMTPPAPAELDNPSSIAIDELKEKRRLLVLNTGGVKVTTFALEPKKSK